MTAPLLSSLSLPVTALVNSPMLGTTLPVAVLLPAVGIARGSAWLEVVALAVFSTASAVAYGNFLYETRRGNRVKVSQLLRLASSRWLPTLYFGLLIGIGFFGAATLPMSALVILNLDSGWANALAAEVSGLIIASGLSLLGWTTVRPGVRATGPGLAIAALASPVIATAIVSPNAFTLAVAGAALALVPVLAASVADPRRGEVYDWARERPIA